MEVNSKAVAAAERVKAEAARPVVADKTKAALEKLKAYKGDTAGDYPEPKCLILQQGGGTLPRGDMQVIKAKSKQGKTFLASIFAAVAMGAAFGDLRAAEKGARVLYFDTEQNKRNACRVARRVHTLCGWSNDDTPRFGWYALRTADTKTRRELICAGIREFKPDLAVIDGVADLIDDFNSVDKSQGLIDELMAVSAEVDCAILFCLHTNKAADDNNMKGHLGTFAVQKCSDVFQIEKAGGTFGVKVTECRNEPIKGFSFALNADGIPYPAAEQLKADKEQGRLNALLDLLQKAYGGDSALSYGELAKRLALHSGKGERTAKRTISDALARGLIKVHGDGYALFDKVEGKESVTISAKE
jgi:hypothetical protein